MILYSVIFMLSAGGMIAIAMRHRDEFYAFNFAAFMENVQKEGGQLWHQHLREKTFIAIEKVLKALRIWLLRMENLLLRILRRVRGIKEKKSA
ncbi:hypothetical protein A2W54_01185 [Candidatus Giovannonibacteria bacterium RIFCSPHIGHO2_02_43_13]|uniref:Uncharacterized protein n=1 Tax=Candidatus Giovannonibacteria bacterium RIFCSPHIGHO2_02_43_13 TaxID=1798330 RepID=A0A1F5WUH8_9BACT|nr:MAG: hypothetical protein A2W54_01185 [Candidatus Giovannonibacteria bacterium RIFCSPHIGHO2_02_43_13]